MVVCERPAIIGIKYNDGRPGVDRTPAGEMTPDQINNLGVQTRSEALVLAAKNNLI